MPASSCWTVSAPEPYVRTVTELPNTYSARWFSTFLDTVPAEQTAKELTFLRRVLPLPAFPSLLDLASGPGRLSLPLAQKGYRVVAWDRDADAIAAARFAAAAEGVTGARFEIRDVRTLSSADGPFDGVVSLWSSFGWFSPTGNRELLRSMAAAIRPGGRIVLDVYDAAFFRGREGERLHARGGTAVRERIRFAGDRLCIELRYGNGEEDRFEWQAFTADALCALAAELGLGTVMACAAFDDSIEPNGEWPRMQLVFERAAPGPMTSNPSS